ncbi:DUF6933 domain-containing protein [Thiothrix nivea]|uniref:DUF6933 domain-containing protein n=1 Tax=Thiothrix nivea (strain ATCC 35100 / DSM 5205 / JP2) TaxID=870187 RepID=A0A656HFN3_THINJ|nr:hypothetical protein [Thiothrix nivea]EIJ35183.1 hypothetical protein Thini_2645 [Thiothrix nivea DSM 5205]
MLIFNCTKAATEFFPATCKGVKQSPVYAPNQDITTASQRIQHTDGSQTLLFQWVLHAITLKRKHCLIAMEVNTRFSVILTAMPKGNPDAFIDRFKPRLLDQLFGFALQSGILKEEQFAMFINEFMAQTADIFLCQRSDRSVQAHINDVVSQFTETVNASGYVPDNEGEMLHFSSYINRTLRKTKQSRDYTQPDEQMLLFWLQQFCGFTPEQAASIKQHFADLHRRSFSAWNDIPDDVKPPPYTDKIVILEDFKAQKGNK